MPFGLKNAGSTFQRYIDSILANVPNTFVYLDDILIASRTPEEHANDLSTAMSLLAKNNLRISLSKCMFFQSSLTFLGYEVSSHGLKPPHHRIAAIEDFPLPSTSSDLRRFMGMLNFFRQMIPHFADIAHPVTELLRYNPSSKSLPWNDSAQESFLALKHALASSPTLTFPSPEVIAYQLVTDSSNFAVGAALYQMVDAKPLPVSFFSKKLSDVQKTYSTYDRELLAAYLAVLHFRTLIDGHPVTLFSDHKPLVSAFYSRSLAKSDRQQRHLSLISEYVSSVEYIRGQNNVVADCLSRPVCATTADAFDLTGIASAQNDDTEIDTYKDRLTPYTLSDNVTLYCDTSTPSPRPFVPSSLRENVIASLHNLSHPGVKNTSSLVKHRYFWPAMDSDIKNFVKNCLECQQSKIHRHTQSPILPISTPSDRFETVHIDIVGPLPSATLPNYPYPLPFRYLLTCIDRATRWAEAIPLVDTTASSVAIAFVNGWVSRFGIPLHVVSDRGAQFEGELFTNLSSILGFHKIRTTSYHPQSNGMIERFHRTLKSSIIARKQNWFTSLPIVMMSLRMSPNPKGFSPFTAVTGTYILVPQPFISPDSSLQTADVSTQSLINEMKSVNFFDFSAGKCHSTPKSYIPDDLQTCSKVWMRVDRIRRSLEAPYSGPFQVLKRHSKFFTLDLPQGETNVSIDRLKPAHLSPGSPLPKASEPSLQPSSSDQTSTNLAPDNTSTSPPLQQTRTRSGRTIRFAQRNEYHYFWHGTLRSERGSDVVIEVFPLDLATTCHQPVPRTSRSVIYSSL